MTDTFRDWITERGLVYAQAYDHPDLISEWNTLRSAEIDAELEAMVGTIKTVRVIPERVSQKEYQRLYRISKTPVAPPAIRLGNIVVEGKKYGHWICNGCGKPFLSHFQANNCKWGPCCDPKSDRRKVYPEIPRGQGKGAVASPSESDGQLNANVTPEPFESAPALSTFIQRLTFEGRNKSVYLRRCSCGRQFETCLNSDRVLCPTCIVKRKKAGRVKDTRRGHRKK